MGLIEIALAEYGVTEIKGRRHNKRILQYSSDIGQKWIRNDETSWCAIFMSWVSLKGGYTWNKKAPTWARGFLEVGRATTKPKPGDIVVFWRGAKSSWKGHVGIYIAEDGKNIWVLGGNQSNKVQISKYPVRRLLGFRRPVKDQ